MTRDSKAKLLGVTVVVLFTALTVRAFLMETDAPPAPSAESDQAPEPSAPAPELLTWPTSEVEPLTPSEEYGLCGAPLPEGTTLVEKTEEIVGRRKERIFTHRYIVRATPEQLAYFYRRRVPGDKWKYSNDTTPHQLVFTRKIGRKITWTLYVGPVVRILESDAYELTMKC